MEILAELLRMLGEQTIEFQSRVPRNPHEEELYRKNFVLMRKILFIVMLTASVALPTYFVFIFFIDGYLSNFYFILSVFLIFAAIIVSLVIYPKITLLLEQYSKKQTVNETLYVEDEVKYELGFETLLLVLSAIPFAHILFCPLVIRRAMNILEMTDASRIKIRKIAANLAGYSVLLFMTNSLVVSLILIILGDTRG
jgi:hypothetical protein